MSQKAVDPYKYMDDWKIFNETSLPEKEDFCSNLNMEDITDADDSHTKRACKNFEMKKLAEYHDLYVQSDTLLLDDVSENFNVCIKIYELDPTKFVSAPGLPWQATIKKTKVKLNLLTNIDLLLMVEKGIRGEISKYMKD